MTSLNFTSTVLHVGTTFIFGSWICVANGLGGFINRIVNFRKPEAFAPTQSSDIDEFFDNFDELLLPDLPRQIERTFVFNVTSIHATQGLLGSDSNRLEEASRSKSLSDLEEDLDHPFKIRDEGDIARRGPPILNYDSDSNEEYPSTTSSIGEGLKDEGATAHREAHFLTTTRNLMITPSHFRAIIRV
jgi:hypothetical protein